MDLKLIKQKLKLLQDDLALLTEGSVASDGVAVEIEYLKTLLLQQEKEESLNYTSSEL